MILCELGKLQEADQRYTNGLTPPVKMRCSAFTPGLEGVALPFTKWQRNAYYDAESKIGNSCDF
jgi:hypothetical protein